MVLTTRLVFLAVLQQLDARQNIAPNAILMIQQNATNAQPMLGMEHTICKEYRYGERLLQLVTAWKALLVISVMYMLVSVTQVAQLAMDPSTIVV
jgi:hypothetical protein